MGEGGRKKSASSDVGGCRVKEGASRVSEANLMKVIKLEATAVLVSEDEGSNKECSITPHAIPPEENKKREGGRKIFLGEAIHGLPN